MCPCHENNKEVLLFVQMITIKTGELQTRKAKGKEGSLCRKTDKDERTLLVQRVKQMHGRMLMPAKNAAMT